MWLTACILHLFWILTYTVLRMQMQLAVGLPPPEFASADTQQLHGLTLAGIAAKRGLPAPGAAATGQLAAQ